MRGWRREEGANRPPSRIESELDLRLAGIKTFETSTGQQDRLQLNHSSSRILFHSISLLLLLLRYSLSLSLFLSLCFLFSSPTVHLARPTRPAASLSLSLSFSSQPLLSDLCCSTRGLSRPDLRASRLHVACPNDVSERTGTTAI